ncbi:MAG: carboxypeptidase-like regulatory domain-containing protein, partial [Longimicrobiales bacterium]|nr:carboxypeptidase-like regulatory domain-containing protein [Longimicrobiales bacterium]
MELTATVWNMMRQQSTDGRNDRRRGRRFGGAWQLLVLFGLLLMGAAEAQAQHSIAGRVTASPGGEPLSGVEVRLVDGMEATLTDADGRYRIVVPETSGTLRFTLLGYGTQDVEFDGQSVINVTLDVQAVELEGVVVIGYGEKSRITLTESVGTVSEEQVNIAPISTPEVALQGQVSGVQVLSQSGNPGAPVSIRIRGVGTVGNTQPLFVIDGIPVGRGSDAFQ